MASLDLWLEKARKSPFYMRLVNWAMWNKIPFNKPHGFKITTITDDGFIITMPYKRNNLNHIKGLHACGLATLSEYVAGLTLLRKIGVEHYRIIMESIHMKYHYQAKMDVTAQFELTNDWIQMHVSEPLKHNDAVFVDLVVEVYDGQKNHICSGTTRWQIKNWAKVKTKVA